MQGISRRIANTFLNTLRANMNVFGTYKSAIRVIPINAPLLAETSSYITVGDPSVAMDGVKFNNYFGSASTLSYLIPHGIVNLPQIIDTKDSEILDFVFPVMNAALPMLSHYKGYYQINGDNSIVSFNYYPIYDFTVTLDGYSRVVNVPDTDLCWDMVDTGSILVSCKRGRLTIASIDIPLRQIILTSSYDGDVIVKYTTTKFSFDSILETDEYTYPSYYDTLLNVYSLYEATRDDTVYICDSTFDASTIKFIAVDEGTRPSWLDITGYIWQDSYTYSGAGSYRITQPLNWDYMSPIVKLGSRVLRSGLSYYLLGGGIYFYFDVSGNNIECIGTSSDSRTVYGYLGNLYIGETTFALPSVDSIDRVTKNGVEITAWSLSGSNVILTTALYSGDSIQVWYNDTGLNQCWVKYIAGDTAGLMDLSAFVTSISSVTVAGSALSILPEYTITYDIGTASYYVNTLTTGTGTLIIDYGVWDETLGDNYIGVIIEIPETQLILQSFEKYYVCELFSGYDDSDPDKIIDLPIPCMVQGLGNNPIFSSNGYQISEETLETNLIPNTGLLFRTRGGCSLIYVSDDFVDVSMNGGLFSGSITLDIYSQDAYTRNVLVGYIGDWLLGKGREILIDSGVWVTDVSHSQDAEITAVETTRYHAAIEISIEVGWFQYIPSLVPLLGARVVTDASIATDGRKKWILPKFTINMEN